MGNVHETIQHRHPEHQYLALLFDLLKAPARPDRTGTGTQSIFHRTMEFDLEKGFPLLTTKRMPFKVIATELLWFLRGDTALDWLHENGVTIWDEWADENGQLGPIYGKQWRRWWGGVDENDYDIVIDQVAAVIKSLKEAPYSRRHVMTTWNVSELSFMALPPCHGLVTQFYVENDGRLSCSMYQRSADAFLGLPFNIASYSLLLHLIASVVGRKPGRFIWTGGDVHLYANHVQQAKLQLTRAPTDLPQFGLLRAPADIDGFELADFALVGYEPHPPIRGEVSV